MEYLNSAAHRTLRIPAERYRNPLPGESSGTEKDCGPSDASSLIPRPVVPRAAASGVCNCPAAGNRNGAGVNNGGSNGNYWSASPNGVGNARNVNFNSGNVNPQNNNNRRNGFSVRLVRAFDSGFPPLRDGDQLYYNYRRAAL